MAYNFSGIKVLVVESSRPLFELVKGVLTLFTVPQSNVLSAYSMEEAYRKLCSERYDLIIVDWLENPDTGIRLARRIRTEKDSPNPYVPILMTAGSGHLHKVMKARDAGVSEYLVKPFSAKTLAAKIERIIEHPRPFVICDTFVGPDRRVREKPFTGPERRHLAPEVSVVGAFQKDKN